MFEDFTNTAQGPCDGSNVGKAPKPEESHRENPAMPGDDATSREKPLQFQHHPELPPAGAGTRAKAPKRPKDDQRASTNPPAGAGTIAVTRQMPIRFEQSSEIPASGPGDDARMPEKAKTSLHHRNNPSQGGAEGQKLVEAHNVGADRDNSPGDGGAIGHRPEEPRRPRADCDNSAADLGGEAGAPNARSKPAMPSAPAKQSRRKAGKIDVDHDGQEIQPPREPVDLRFTDPLVAEIVQLHRMRRRWMKAKNALILQGKAFGRAVCDGDKEAGSAAFDRVAKGKASEDDETLMVALAPFIAAIARFDEDIKPIEKRLEKLAQKLPIAPWVKTVTGLGFGSVAAIVGEAGDLSAYPSVAGVWKRMGLAVIDGDGRQRKVASAEGALVHGYNPERRSVVWVMADSMSKLQRTWLDKETGEVRKPAGAYGVILEAEKEKALAAGLTKAHAEARGKRHMSKAVLRDMTAEWRRAVGHLQGESREREADRPQFLEAAE